MGRMAGRKRNMGAVVEGASKRACVDSEEKKLKLQFR
jgi:hypothetical protein